MAKKKNTKAAPKKPMFDPERTLINEQEVDTEDAELNISVEAMPIEECTVSVAVDEMPTEVTISESPAGELTVVKPLYGVGVEDMTEELSTTCGPMPKQPRVSPYTEPPVELLIGPDEIIHYVPRHLLPHNLGQNGSMKQLYLRDIDIGTGHVFIHYFHTGLYETINTEGNSTMLATSIRLKQALSVHLATINYGISCLNELAISEMRTHASRLNLVEFIRAIGEGFQSLGPESWVHEFLQQKAKAAFEENPTVFTSEAFLNTLDNSKVNKFMMRYVAECYDNKISNMGSRYKEMSEILNDCQESLRVLSQKKVVSEQNNAVQHQFITPLAVESSISECFGIRTFQDDLIFNEDFCTISCPSSECSNESQGCLEELTNCSAEPREHSQNARKLPYEAALAGPMSCEQHSPSTYLAPDFSIEASHGPIGGPAVKQCGGKPKRGHYELQISKESVSANRS